MLPVIKVDNEIELRLLEKKDAEELFALVDQNRNFLSRWMPWMEGTKSQHDSEEFIELAREDFANERSVQYKIIYKGKISGMFGINDIDKRNKSVSFGYWLGEIYQDNGIMIKVCTEIKNYLIKHNGIHRIEIRADEDNGRSRKIPEKLSFKLEGILLEADWINNEYKNICIYSFINRENI